MYSPTLNLAVVRERQADLLREAEHERLAAVGRTPPTRMRAFRAGVGSLWRARLGRPATARPAY